MTRLKTVLTRTALALAIGGSALAATAVPASADTACNRYGECWHVASRYTTYPTTLGISFYDDNWWQDRHNHRGHRWLRNRSDDHGYYMHGRWHPF